MNIDIVYGNVSFEIFNITNFGFWKVVSNFIFKFFLMSTLLTAHGILAKVLIVAYMRLPSYDVDEEKYSKKWWWEKWKSLLVRCLLFPDFLKPLTGLSSFSSSLLFGQIITSVRFEVKKDYVVHEAFYFWIKSSKLMMLKKCF